MNFENILLFVYGTLMKDQMNFRILKQAEFIKICRTEYKFTMLHPGRYPAVVKKPEVSINGELYLVLQNFQKPCLPLFYTGFLKFIRFVHF